MPFTGSRVLLFDASPQASRDLCQRLEQRGLPATRVELDHTSSLGVEPHTGDVAIILVDPQRLGVNECQVASILNKLVSGKIATVVHGDAPALKRESGPLIEWLDPQTSLDELAGKVSTLARYVPLVQGLERELSHLHRLGEQLNRYFGEIDQEMRLAGRLQRDFLPHDIPQIAPYSFAVFYRPASWVSGDMYDVFRIDEHHLGMFVSDAMGHGVAAGLLTMFLRQALVAKRIEDDHYTIVRPAEALDTLHNCLVRQQLPNSQFVTAAYAVLNTRSGVCTLARAGHPYPLLMKRDGAIREVRSGGSLLGLPDFPAEFEEVQIQLEAGDKLAFYTDGIEEVVVVPGAGTEDDPVFTDQLKHWATLPAEQISRAVGDYLDCREGSLHPADDVTVLLLEVDP